MWTLTLCFVFRDIIDYVSAIWFLSRQRGGRRDSGCLGYDNGSFTFQGTTRMRSAQAVFSGIIQMGIALTLLVSGSVWLVYTPSVTDLLLNGVALSFIMQLDELI